MTVLAALDGLEGDRDTGAVSGLQQIDLHSHRDVPTRRGTTLASPKRAAAAKEGIEEIADRAKTIEVGGVTTGAQPVVAVAVEGRAALRIGQDLVGLGSLLELLLGVRIVRVDVGMQLARERRNAFLTCCSEASRETPSTS